MKAIELMIGDWVNLAPGDNNNNINPVQVVAIDYDKEISEDYVIDIVFPITGLVQFNYSQRSLKPIPLTSEILEKNDIKLLEVGDNGSATPAKYRNRYEKWQIHTKWKDTYLWYDRRTKRWNLYDMNGAQFTYVHEFQHALRLCEIEKNIEL